MVIVYGGVAVDPARVAEVTERAAAFEAVCRQEPGCIDYILAWQIADPTRIQLVEAWETVQASEAHRQREHVREWAQYIAAASVGQPQFSEHVIG